MATATGKTHCAICGKEKATIRCSGCLNEFCYKHWEPHRQELNKQLDEIELNRDLFRQLLNQQIEQPNSHVLMKQIDQWERDLIKKITKVAEETKQKLIQNSSPYIHQVEVKLNELTNQLRQSRQEDDFNEINLRQFREELNRLTEQLTKPLNISIQEDPSSFISQISIVRSGEL